MGWSKVRSFSMAAVCMAVAAAGCVGSDVDETSDEAHVETSRALEVAMGDAFACVLDPGRGVFCWGDNHYGQLGQAPPRYEGTGGIWESAEPLFVEGTQRARLLAVGRAHACVATPDDVLCWGANDAGQLGVDSAEEGTCWDSASHVGMIDVACQPAPTSLGRGAARKLAAGADATCIGRDGETTCLGFTYYDLAAIAALDDVALGRRDGCGITSTGELRCVGENRPDAFAVLGSIGAVEDVAVGPGANACVVQRGGSVRCSGSSNESGQLGAGHTDIVSPWHATTPVEDAVEVRAGAGHFCARSADGQVTCWGRNTYGQVGVDSDVPEDGGTEMTDPETPPEPEGICRGGICEPTPIHVEDLPEAASLATGGASTCVTTADRRVLCWGRLVGTSDPTPIAGAWEE